MGTMNEFDIRVAALDAAVRTVSGRRAEPNSSRADSVLEVADRYMSWLNQDAVATEHGAHDAVREGVRPCAHITCEGWSFCREAFLSFPPEDPAPRTVMMCSVCSHPAGDHRMGPHNRCSHCPCLITVLTEETTDTCTGGCSTPLIPVRCFQCTHYAHEEADCPKCRCTGGRR